MPGRKRKSCPVKCKTTREENQLVSSEEEQKEEEESVQNGGDKEHKLATNILKNIFEGENGSEALLNAIKEHKSKSFNLEIALSRLSDDNLVSLWTSVNALTAETVLGILDHHDSSVELINAIITLTKHSIEVVKKDAIPAGLYQTLLVLHGVLSTLPSDFDNIKNGICKLCELWFTKGLDDKDSFVSNAVMYLLQRTLGNVGTKSDVKRVHALHTTLLNDRLQDSTCEKLRGLLLKAVKSPLYLKCPEGVRFIAFLFTLSPTFVKQLHTSIKENIPGCTQGIALAYGDIYVKAWTNSAGNFQTCIEEDCIQDLMYRGVMANRSLPKSIQVFEPILKLLGQFNSARNNKKLQAMICRLWEPILWRHLHVANSDVRCNAAQLFLDAFPVEDPDEELAETAAKQEAQVAAMKKLLLDESPEVRIVTVDGVVEVLSRFWFILSHVEISDLMATLIRDLANDAASSRVRQAVVKGMCFLVKHCPRSHMYLKKVLPKLEDRLHDVNESVRVAMMDLLESVKVVKVIQYWDICTLDNLLARLVTDKPGICYRIVKLLFNSFFPLEKSETSKLERCLYLVKNNQLASRKFYQYSEKLTELHDSVKFMLAILVTIKRFVESKLDRRDLTAIDSDTEGPDKENSVETRRKQRKLSSQPKKIVVEQPIRGGGGGGGGDTESTLIEASTILSEDTTLQDGRIQLAENTIDCALEDSQVVSGLVDIVCILWMVRSQELAEAKHAEYRSLLEKKAAKILSVLFKYYKSGDVCWPLIYLASFLPHSSISTVAGFCLSRLKTVALPANYSEMVASGPVFSNTDPIPTYTDALCNWGRGGDVLDFITYWIQRDVRDRKKVNLPTLSMSGKKSVRFAEPSHQPRPRLALLLVKYLLCHKVNRPMLMKKNRTQLKELHDALSSYIPLLPRYFDDTGEEEDKANVTFEVFSSAWDMYLKLTVLLHGNKPEDEEDDCYDILDNALNCTIENAVDSVRTSRLARSTATTLVHVCSNIIMLNLCDSNLVYHCMQLAELMLSKDGSINSIRPVCHLLFQIARWSSSVDGNVPDNNATSVPKLYARLLQCLSLLHKETEKDVDKGQLHYVKKYLVAIIETYHNQFSHPFTQEIMRSHMDSVHTSYQHSIKKSNALEFQTVKELPPVLGMLFDTITAKKQVLCTFLNEWSLLVKKDPPRDLLSTATLTSMLNLFAKASSSSSKPCLKEVASTLEMRLEEIGKDGYKDDCCADEEQLIECTSKTLAVTKEVLGIV